MILLLLTTIAVLGLLEAGPLYKATLNINFAPESAMVVNEAETQIFRAPICEGMYVDTWVFTVKTYLMNVPWDSYAVGDDNWLRIQVSNSSDMRWIIADNVDGINEPQPGLPPFKYQASTWGSEDVYIAITASSGSPTYQYGVEMVGAEATAEHGNRGVPDVTPKAKLGDPLTVAKIEIMEQIAVPYHAVLSPMQTAQFKVPFCFEAGYRRRSVTGTVIVPSDLPVNKGRTGGVATFFCTTGMMRHDECFRSLVKKRGNDFYDPSGAIINTVTPVIVKEEYGAVYLLVLAQGDYAKDVGFTITTKLRHPDKASLLLSVSGDHEQDMGSVLNYLKDSCVRKPVSLDTDEPEELKKKNEL